MSVMSIAYWPRRHIASASWPSTATSAAWPKSSSWRRITFWLISSSSATRMSEPWARASETVIGRVSGSTSGASASRSCTSGEARPAAIATARRKLPSRTASWSSTTKLGDTTRAVRRCPCVIRRWRTPSASGRMPPRSSPIRVHSTRTTGSPWPCATRKASSAPSITTVRACACRRYAAMSSARPKSSGVRTTTQGRPVRSGSALVGCSSEAVAGISTVKVEPSPGTLVTPIVPPKRSVRRLQIARPSPVPP